MRNLRIAGALALVATAALVLAAGAGATRITSDSGTTPTISGMEKFGHIVLDNPIAKIECTSNLLANVESHGTGVTVQGKVTLLQFGSPTPCTNSWHVTVISGGSLEIHAIGGGNGTVTSSGATIEATRFGITCRYATSGTDIGTLTAGIFGEIDISAAIPFHSGSGLCGTGATTWTGQYALSGPTNVSVDS